MNLCSGRDYLSASEAVRKKETLSGLTLRNPAFSVPHFLFLRFIASKVTTQQCYKNLTIIIIIF